MNRLPYLWVALVLLCLVGCGADPPRPPAASTKLIECPDCGNMVSKRAKHCVKCGAPIVEDLKEPAYSAPPPPAVAPFDSGKAKTLQKAWANHLGVPVQIANSLGMKLNLIPPGEFTMGSPKSEYHRSNNETWHLVRITKPFYLSVHEVTQQQYEKVMDKNPSKSKGTNKPVERVSWHDVVDFCSKLSEQEGVEYRLPTEAEWEYACRAGMTTTYSFGDDRSRLGEYAWYNGNRTNPNALLSNDTPHPVGELKPNAWGLFDMHGNVKEWCQDRYGNYEGLGVVGRDPTGPASGDDSRVLRARQGGAARRVFGVERSAALETAS